MKRVVGNKTYIFMFSTATFLIVICIYSDGVAALIFMLLLCLFIVPFFLSETHIFVSFVAFSSSSNLFC